MNPELAEFLKQVDDLVVPVQSPIVEFRVYYNQDGDIIACTQTLPVTDQSGPYLVVDRGQFDRYFDYRVVSGALKKIDQDAGHRVQLIKSNKGYEVVAGHAGVVIEPGEEYNYKEYYERKANN